MSNFTVIKLQANTGTDASPVWSDFLFGTAGYELRFCSVGAGTASTPSASWPTFPHPIEVVVVPEAWLFTSDTSGTKITVYDGTGAHYNQFRISADNTGTLASAPTFSAYADNTFPADSPGTQPGSPNTSSAVINGSSETGNTSYLKAAFYGVGLTSGGVADNPSSNYGTNPTATSGTAGALTTSQGAWSGWTSLQGTDQYIANGQTPKATTAWTWNFLLSLMAGPLEEGGVLTPVLALEYSYT